MSVCLIAIVLSVVAGNAHPETRCVFESEWLGRAIGALDYPALSILDGIFSVAEHHRRLCLPKPVFLLLRISHTNPVPKVTEGLSSPGEGCIELGELD